MKTKPVWMLLLAVVVAAGAAVAPVAVRSWREHCIERDKTSTAWLYSGFRPDWCPEAQGPDVDWAAVERESFPHSGDYETSTEFFLHLVERGVICCNVNYSLFALPGVKACDSTNAADFRPENNAWCVALDAHPQEGIPDVPFLFSRNLDIQRLDQATPDALRDIPPYGRKGVLVLYPGYYSSRVEFIPPERIATDFNPTGATNPVLRP